MREVLASISVLVGATFTLLAAIGAFRFPDVFTRMQAATKAATFGVSFALLAAAIAPGDAGVAVQCAGTIAFLFVTSPVAAHMVARAAYLVGIPLWHGVDSRPSPIWSAPRGREDGRSSLPPPGGP